MKKILITVFILCISISTFAQESVTKENEKIETLTKRHEVKLNLLYSILGLPEISYEYLLNEESSVGMSLLFRLDKDIDIKFAATPYYRFFFSKKPAAGFFIEGFGMYSVEEDYDYGETTTSDFALGISVGVKLLSKKGFTGELYAGLGRNLFGNHDIDAVPRIGISFGKRF